MTAMAFISATQGVTGISVNVGRQAGRKGGYKCEMTSSGKAKVGQSCSRRAFLTAVAGAAALTMETEMSRGQGESDLGVVDVRVGDGKEISSGELAKVHYTLTLGGFEEDGGRVIDSSRSRRKAFSYTYDTGSVIKGWDMGVKGMKVGGRRRLVIPSELGYGARGVGKVIPGNSTLYFDIELLGVGYK